MVKKLFAILTFMYSAKYGRMNYQKVDLFPNSMSSTAKLESNQLATEIDQKQDQSAEYVYKIRGGANYWKFGPGSKARGTAKQSIAKKNTLFVQGFTPHQQVYPSFSAK